MSGRRRIRVIQVDRLRDPLGDHDRRGVDRHRRNDRDDRCVDHAHESPGVMIWPLRLLAVLSMVGGVIGIENVFGKIFDPASTEASMGFGEKLFEPFNSSPLGATFGLGAVLFGAFAAWAIYGRRMVDPLPEKLGFISRAMRNRFYFDELYENVLIPCTQELASRIADAVDRFIIGGLGVRGVPGVTELAGRALRLRRPLRHSFSAAAQAGSAAALSMARGRRVTSRWRRSRRIGSTLRKSVTRSR